MHSLKLILLICLWTPLLLHAQTLPAESLDPQEGPEAASLPKQSFEEDDSAYNSSLPISEDFPDTSDEPARQLMKSFLKRKITARDRSKELQFQTIPIHRPQNRLHEEITISEILDILIKNHGAQGLYNPLKQSFIGNIVSLNESGASTSFLYRVENSQGEPVFIIKGINNQQEVNHLEKLSTSHVFSAMPHTRTSPILTWPEAIYSYPVKQPRAPYMQPGEEPEIETKYFSVLNVARGKSLADLYNTENQETLINVFFAIGQAIATFNLHCAGYKSGQITFQQLTNDLSFSHEDLHWHNIFVHNKPDVNAAGEKIALIYPYRVYLIDTESLWKSFNDSFSQKAHSQKRTILQSQFIHLYAWPLFVWGKITLKDPRSLSPVFYNGLIKGYASQFKDPHVAERELLSIFCQINSFVKSAYENPLGEKPSEAIQEKMNSVYAYRALYNQIGIYRVNQINTEKILSATTVLALDLLHQLTALEEED